MWFDSDFSLSKHVQNVCKNCKKQLCGFRHVRRLLTHDTSILVANALVSSRLDYCNSLFSLRKTLSKFNVRTLQCIQNSTARTLSDISRYASITPVLKKLHWLSVEHRSVLKIAPLLFTSYYTLVFLSILLHISLPTAVLKYQVQSEWW